MLEKLLAGAVIGAAVLAPVAAHAEAAAEPAAESTQCRFGQWPGAAEGRSDVLKPGAPAGAYLWHSADGWHLFVTHPGDDRRTFKGSIASRSRIHDVARRTEGNDSVVSRNSHRVLFRFQNYGHLDGVDFRMSCGRGFTVRVDAPVFVGRNAELHTSPVTITRQR